MVATTTTTTTTATAATFFQFLRTYLGLLLIADVATTTTREYAYFF